MSIFAKSPAEFEPDRSWDPLLYPPPGRIFVLVFPFCPPGFPVRKLVAVENALGRGAN